MKKKIFILIITIMMFSTTAFANEQAYRAILVNSMNNADFPSASNLSGSALKEEIHQIIDVASYYQFNTVVFEVRPQGDALYQSKHFPTSAFLTKKQGDFTMFNPLQYMVKYANSKEIVVYPSVNLFTIGSSQTVLDKKNFASKYPEKTRTINGTIYLDPTDESVRQLIADGVSEIMKKYNVPGVLLSGLNQELLEHFPTLPENIVDISNRIHKKNSGKSLGITVSKQSMPYLESAITNQNFKFIFADIDAPVLETQLYQKELAYWNKISETTGIAVVPQNKVSEQDDRIHMNLTLQQQSQNQFKGYAFNHYTSFTQNNKASDEFLTMQTGNTYTQTSLSAIPRKLAITRPTKNLTTTLEQYFIMGTSDPSQPLFLNGKELDRKSKSGVFGAHINVSVGENIVSVKQGNESVSVTITRQVSSGTPSKISKITANSVVPKFNDFVRNGSVFKASCIAPAGSTVTAQLGTQIITLKQVAAASDGVPAKFTGEFIINSNIAQNAVEKIGQITYAMNGSTVTTDAALFVAGADANVVVKVNAYMASVLTDYKTQGKFTTTLTENIMDIATSSIDDYFELKSGGYIEKQDVDILTGNNTVLNQATGISFTKKDRQETFTLKGVKTAPYHSSFDGTTLKVTLFYVENPQDISVEDSYIFSSANKQVDGNRVTYTLTTKQPNLLWGYSVEPNQEGDFILYCNRKPELSKTKGKPLEGISILLDAGHGGNDPGALGVTGKKGINEKELNYEVTNAVKIRLEQLGANVSTTSTMENRVLLDERIQIAQKIKPDFLISLHHNSLPESTDAYKVTGTEVYYHTPALSETLSKNMLNQVTGILNRKARGTFESYYYITRITFAPSLLLEIGYVPNPTEFEQMSEYLTIYKTALGVSQAIIDTLA